MRYAIGECVQDRFEIAGCWIGPDGRVALTDFDVVTRMGSCAPIDAESSVICLSRLQAAQTAGSARSNSTCAQAVTG